MSGRRAATIAEVLLAAAIGLALMAIVLGAFRQLGAAGRQGESKISSQIRARQAARRVVPYLRFARSPNTAVEAIYYPEFEATASNVVFAIPEDPLGGGPPFDPRNPHYFLYQIRFDSASRKLMVHEFYNPAQASTMATDISAFNVTRSHPHGLVMRLRTEARFRDLRGMMKTIPYDLEEAIEVPH